MTIKVTRILTTLQGDRFVYCCQAWQQAMSLITLRIPITSPPVDVSNFDPRWMERKPFLIFKLHGEENDPNWYGMDYRGTRYIALTPDLVKAADLEGAIVLAIVCHGLGQAMEYAFFQAGARAVIGSPVEVRGRETRMGEADQLVHILLRQLAQSTEDLARTLASAKQEYLGRKEEPTEHDLFTAENFAISLKEDLYA